MQMTISKEQRAKEFIESHGGEETLKKVCVTPIMFLLWQTNHSPELGWIRASAIRATHGPAFDHPRSKFGPGAKGAIHETNPVCSLYRKLLTSILQQQRNYRDTFMLKYEFALERRIVESRDTILNEVRQPDANLFKPSS